MKSVLLTSQHKNVFDFLPIFTTPCGFRKFVIFCFFGTFLTPSVLEAQCSLTITPSVSNCFRDASSNPLVTVNFNVTWLNPTNDSIAITFNSVTKYIVGVGTSGVSSRSMSFNVSAGTTGTAIASIVGDAACTVTSANVVTVDNCSPVPTPCATDPNTIGGLVFQDYNADGVKSSTEIGKDDIVVKVYDCNGNLKGTTTSDVAGNWFMSGLDFSTATSKYRVEFSIPNTLTDFKPSFSGSSNGTDVQFVTAASCAVNFGVNDPNNYCETNPPLATNCYINGLPNNTEHVLVTAPLPTTSTTVNYPLADANEIGSTWGLAYTRNNKTLYAATFLKRHVGILNDRLGMIYTQNMADTTQAPTAWLDVITLGIDLGQSLVPTNAARGLGGISAPSYDAVVFDLVGKAGFGDIDISSDEKTLYFVNLHDKKLYAIDIASKTVKSGFPVSIPDNCSSGKGAMRPFALKYFNAKIYVGTVCDAQTSQQNIDLQANVYSYDGTTMTNVLSFPLNYPKGNPFYAGAETNKGWYPWTSTWISNTDISIAQPAKGYAFSYPQPILSDIEFDKDGDMIMGFMDRMGHQSGAMQYGIGTGTKQFSTIVGGDILRADYVLGTFILENNGAVGEKTSALGVNNNQGPGGGEFYAGDTYVPTTTGHEENVLGGLAISWGLNRTLVTTMDPNAFLTGGINSLRNDNGSRAASLKLYTTTYTTGSASTTFGKAAGIGDIELMCSTPLLEVGNYVWIDTDKDGVQDPCEPPLSNVTVSLWKNSVQIASTTTNSNGEYYFSSKSNLEIPANWTGTGADTTLLPNMAYQIRIDTAAQTTIFSKLALTIAKTTTNTGNDQNDNDATTSSVYKVISFTTGAAGSTNHTLDFGFYPFCDTTLVVKDTAICNGSTVDLFTLASGVKGSLTYSTDGTTWTALASPTNVTPSVTTTYYIKDTLVSGCFDIDTLVITVNPQPTTPSVSSPVMNICH